ncbi:MAG TPA: family 78 glycoside hydrolase catalytic domain [Bacteroidales bacterium]|nr:family 78 glycoside hydrolase catalytic domain [Bacteroidales bacterium]
MKNICFIIPLIFLTACRGFDQKTTDNIFSEKKEAEWITDSRPLPEHDSLFYSDHPAPLFRKEFETDNDIRNARLFITAAGYYRVFVNGRTIDDNVLDPAWTDFSKTIYYSEYDVTQLVADGPNCLGVSVGNGFYNPLPLLKWGRRNLRKDLTVGKPAFIAKLIITYNNGKTEEIISDRSWKYAYGPVVKNCVYLGVVFDGRKIIKGWDRAGFDDSLWPAAITGISPGGELKRSFFPPVRVTEEIIPVKIYSPENGIYIADLGVNFTGTYRIRLSGNEGDTITFRFGERIYDHGTLNPMTTVAGQIKRKGMGGPGAPDIAWQTDSYIIGPAKEEWFTPDFTYHTFRYMEIAGLGYQPDLTDITGLFMHSGVPAPNHFSCSSRLLNSIQEMTARTFRANLVSVQSDCPAREKFGYGGDLNATSESFIYNYDMQSFYRKTIYDWVDAMNDSSFVDTAPYVGIKYCGISWESAFLITQYYLYLYYNDTEIIRELYDQDLLWMEKAARLHPEGMVHEGLSDHESLEPVPVELTGTCHYLRCARIMQVFASVMGDEVNEKKFRQLELRLKALIKAEFWDKPVKGRINRQTLFSTLLYHDIIPDDETEAATDSLRAAIASGPSGHFTTGIFGTRYALEALSEYGSPQEVFNIVNSRAFPGWGYMTDRGATTLWETWKESDNTYSNCHPMFGSVTEWFYRWLGGIRTIAGEPGFKKFILAPTVPDGLDYVNCCYHSPSGEIISDWKKDGPDAVIYELKIPEGSTALVNLQSGRMVSKTSIMKNEKPPETSLPEGSDSGRFELGGGEYIITVSYRSGL